MNKMKNIYFYLKECSYLRYYMPLIEELNKRNITSHMLVSFSKKYNCPSLEKNYTVLSRLLNNNNIQSTVVADKTYQLPDNSVMVTMEGRGIDELQKTKGVTVYSLVSNCDFVSRYDKYIDKPVDYVVFPSQKFANYYNKLSDKNLYLGSPKYCIDLKREVIINKYGLDHDKKYALIVFPKLRDVVNSNVERHITYLKNNNYIVLVKSRAKDSAHNLNDKKYLGDFYFEDSVWYPHDTMELICISDIVINYSSSTIKESVMLRTPMINFDIKPKIKDLYKVFWDQRAQSWAEDTKFLPFLYENNVCRSLDPNCNNQTFSSEIKSMSSIKESSFDNVISDFLFNKNTVLDNIIKHMLNVD